MENTDGRTPIAEGCAYYHTPDGIAIVDIDSVRRGVVDSLYAWIHDRINRWDANTPYLALYDMRHESVNLTPYMRAKASESHDLRQEVKGAIAVVLVQDPFTLIMSLFARLRRNKSRKVQIFFSMEEGLAWLREVRDTFTAEDAVTPGNRAV